MAAVLTWPLMRDLIKTVVLDAFDAGVLATIIVVVVIWMIWPVTQYSWDALGKLRRHWSTAAILEGIHRGPKIRTVATSQKACRSPCCEIGRSPRSPSRRPVAGVEIAAEEPETLRRDGDHASLPVGAAPDALR